jgi:acylglycerol lipase
MRHSEGTFGSRDEEVNIYWQAWQPEGEAHAVLVLAHGLGEHSSRYGHVAGALAAGDYGLYALDFRGFGKSEGKRGHAPGYESLLDDYGLLIGVAHNAHPGAKVFVYGHSMGGQLALNYALRRPDGLAGVIASGVWLKLAHRPPGWKVTLAHLLSEHAPQSTMGNGMDRSALSRDPAVVEAYNNDPLVHDRVSARLAQEMFDGADYALEHAPELTVPVLLLHGSGDRICDLAGARLFYERAGSDDKTFREYEGMYHEVHNDPEQEQVFADILEWLAAHL